METQQELTDRQKAQYVSSGGVKCPYCGDHDLDMGPICAGGTAGFRAGKCRQCQSEWVAIYSVTGVERASKPGDTTAT